MLQLAHALRTPLLAALLIGLVPAKDDDLLPNAPELNPYLGTDLQLMDEAGFVSLGGFEFGTTDTAAVDKLLRSADIRWIETAHFEMGFGLPEYKASAKERKKIEAELEVLRETLPDLPRKGSRLDRWVRAILFASRIEQVHARVSELLQVTDDMFSDGEAVWTSPETYFGWGSQFGQRGKFELLLLPGENKSRDYLRETFGVIVSSTQRWNVIDRDSLIIVFNDASDGLNKDPNMHAHVAYNLAINLLDGYRHYSYDIPVWLSVGFGHLVEREINPYYNTFDMSEGGETIDARENDWHKHVVKLVAADEVPSIAKLMRIDDYGDMTFDLHAVSWSYVQYLSVEHPEGFAKILGRIKSLLNEENVPDGAGMPNHLREAFAQELGMTYGKFQAAWSEWLTSEPAGLLNDLPRR